MSRNDILENIFSLIKYINPRVNGIDIDKLGEAFFFGKELGLQPRDLVYLLDEVSNQYHKEISSDVINKYQFKKVDDIVNFILEG